MRLPVQLHELPAWAWAGLAFGAAWLMLRPKDAAAAGQVVGEAAVNAADGLVAGVVNGVGGLFGIPATNEAKCRAALAANNGRDASLYCPAGTLIAAIPDSFADWWAGISIPGVTYSKAPASQSGGYFSGPRPKDPSPGTAPSILNGGSFQTQSDCLLLGVTCSPDGTPAGAGDIGEWIEQHNRNLTPVAGTRG